MPILTFYSIKLVKIIFGDFFKQIIKILRFNNRKKNIKFVFC